MRPVRRRSWKERRCTTGRRYRSRQVPGEGAPHHLGGGGRAGGRRRRHGIGAGCAVGGPRGGPAVPAGHGDVVGRDRLHPAAGHPTGTGPGRQHRDVPHRQSGRHHAAVRRMGGDGPHLRAVPRDPGAGRSRRRAGRPAPRIHRTVGSRPGRHAGSRRVVPGDAVRVAPVLLLRIGEPVAERAAQHTGRPRSVRHRARTGTAGLPRYRSGCLCPLWLGSSDPARHRYPRLQRRDSVDDRAGSPRRLPRMDGNPDRSGARPACRTAAPSDQRRRPPLPPRCIHGHHRGREGPRPRASRRRSTCTTDGRSRC